MFFTFFNKYIKSINLLFLLCLFLNGKELFAALTKHKVNVIYKKNKANISKLQIPYIPTNFNSRKKYLTSFGIYYDRKTLNKLTFHNKKIILTFDDGPNPKTTPKILEILKKRRLKAIFFVIGLQIQKYPNLLKQIAKEGHIIGNHTFHHKNLSALNKEQIINEIDSTNNLIEKITGQKVKYLRPPYGALNKTAINIIEQKGMNIMLWNIDPKDWQNKNKYTTLRNLEYQLKMGKKHEHGGVILMHDIYTSTVSALPIFLNKLAENNYNIVTINSINTNSSHNLWACKSPFLFDKHFKHKFVLKNTNNDLLINMLSKKKKNITTCEFLKAYKSGNLIAFLIDKNI